MMKPRLPWQVATRPLTAEDGWRAPSTQEASVYIYIHIYIHGMLRENNFMSASHSRHVIYLFLIDVAG